MKNIIYLFTLGLLLSFSFSSFAQDPADSTDVYGCMDPAGLNYNPLATIDNGYCIYYCDSTSAYIMVTASNDSNIYVLSETYSLSPITEYFWDFGDGFTSSLESPAHFYNEAGVYELCLTITAPGEDSASVCTSTACVSIAVSNGIMLYVNNAVIYGCTDPFALNFNPLANYSDGSCIYANDSTDVYGCMDPVALNYNPMATIDDGSCFYSNDTTVVYGCMDPLAINYNPIATIDDGSCVYIGDSTAVFGCTDTSALNYNPLATIDDGSCSYYCDSTQAYFYISSIDEATGMIYVVNNSYTLDPITEFIWDFGDGQTSNEEFPIHEYESEGFYMLCLTILVEAPNGFMVCTSTYCDTIGISQMMLKSNGMTLNVIPETMTGIDQQIQHISEIKLYPNPASSTITLSYYLNSSENLSAKIYDLSGRVVQSSIQSSPSGYNEIQLDISQLSPGLYQLELRNNTIKNFIRFQVIN